MTRGTGGRFPLLAPALIVGLALVWGINWPIMKIALLEIPVWTWHWASPDDSRVPWSRARRIVLDTDTHARKLHAVEAFRSQLEPDAATGRAPILPDHAYVIPAGKTHNFTATGTSPLVVLEVQFPEHDQKAFDPKNPSGPDICDSKENH